MKKVLLVLIIALTITSCKKKKAEPESIPEVFPSAITGKLYGVPFTTKVALHKYNSFHYNDYKAEDVFNFYLAADATKNCASDYQEFSVRFTVPRKVGKYNFVPLLVNDPHDPTGTEGFLIYSQTSTVEITSITADKVIGKATLIDEQLNTNTSIKGSFEATICQ